jgi:enoyl-CoA hydratase/carnithine racemase
MSVPHNPAPAAGQPPHLAVDGPIATITLRRPGVANRLDLDDLAVLQAQLAALEAQPGVRVLKLQGEGRHFCSGFHIGQVGGERDGAGDRFDALADAVERARPVTVAVLQGGAFGGAADLALACDFRVGGPASEMQVPAARLGLHYYRGGLERFVHTVGLPAARRILVAVDRLDAAQMSALQLLDRCAGDTAGVPALADALCAQLAALAPLAVQGMKKHLRRIARGTLDADELARDIARAGASADLQEGARAWAEKRAPRFEGR